MNIHGTMLTYPGWEADKESAEKLYVEFASSRLYRDKLNAMRNKQRLYEGDRSHSIIVELDSAVFTYPGWLEDKRKAEQRFVGDCATIDLGDSAVKTVLNIMKKKQALYDGRDSNECQCLRQLDNFLFTYPGWEDDKKQAETYYIEYEPNSVFEKKFEAMKNKQRIYEGDRSHPDIQALDELELSYPGYEIDKAEALKRITGDCFVLDMGRYSFQTLISTMKKKQQDFANVSGNECAQTLSSLSLSYPDWSRDVETAKTFYMEFSAIKPFRDKVEAMKNKQRLHVGDRSHPDIVALDAFQFTYDGWQADKAEAERRHIGDCSLLDLGSFGYETIVQKMKKKQQIHFERSRHEGNYNVEELVTVTPRTDAIPNLRRCSTSSFATNETELTSSSSLSWDEEAQETDDKKCVVCLEEESSHAFIPCGHLCVCVGCAEDYHSKCSNEITCPLCREPTICVTKIYS